jgi:hypothetical protein
MRLINEKLGVQSRLATKETEDNQVPDNTVRDWRRF